MEIKGASTANRKEAPIISDMALQTGVKMLKMLRHRIGAIARTKVQGSAIPRAAIEAVS
jgi:hypothetical protein